MRWPWSSEAPEPGSSWTDGTGDGSGRTGSRERGGATREAEFDEIEERAHALEEQLKSSIQEAEAKLAQLEQERRRVLRDIQQAREHGDTQREEHAEWEHYQIIERKETWFGHLANQKKLLHEHLHRKDIVRVRELEGRISDALEDVERLIQEKAPQLATQEGLGESREKIRRNHERLEARENPSSIDEVGEDERERNQQAIEEGLSSLDEEEGD